MNRFIEESLKPFRRFQVKVTVAMICSMLFVVALSDTLIQQFALNFQFNKFNNHNPVCNSDLEHKWKRKRDKHFGLVPIVYRSILKQKFNIVNKSFAGNKQFAKLIKLLL